MCRRPMCGKCIDAPCFYSERRGRWGYDSGSVSDAAVSVVQVCNSSAIITQKRLSDLPSLRFISKRTMKKRSSALSSLRSESAPGKFRGYSVELNASEVCVVPQVESERDNCVERISYFGRKARPINYLQIRDFGVCSGRGGTDSCSLYLQHSSDPLCYKHSDNKAKNGMKAYPTSKPMRDPLSGVCSRDTSSTTLASTICINGSHLAHSVVHRNRKPKILPKFGVRLSLLPFRVRSQCCDVHENAKRSSRRRTDNDMFAPKESFVEDNIKQCCKSCVDQVGSRMKSGRRTFNVKSARYRVLQKKLLVLSQRLALKTQEVKFLRKFLVRLGCGGPPSLAYQNSSGIASAGPSSSGSDRCDHSTLTTVAEERIWNALCKGGIEKSTTACKPEGTLCGHANVCERKREALEKLLNARSGTIPVVKEAFILHVLSNLPSNIIGSGNNECCRGSNSLTKVAFGGEEDQNDGCRCNISFRSGRGQHDTACVRTSHWDMIQNEEVRSVHNICGEATKAPQCSYPSLQDIGLRSYSEWNRPRNYLSGFPNERQHWTGLHKTHRLKERKSPWDASSGDGTSRTKYFVFSSSGTSPSESSADESAGDTSRGSRVCGCRSEDCSCNSCDSHKISLGGDEDGHIRFPNGCDFSPANQLTSLYSQGVETSGVQSAVGEADEWLQMWLQRSSGRALSLSSDDTDRSSCAKRETGI